MRTVEPVDREYVLFKKNIMIYRQDDTMFFKHSVWGKMPSGGNGQLPYFFCSEHQMLCFSIKFILNSWLNKNILTLLKNYLKLAPGS